MQCGQNGFVHLPEQAAWLAEYFHELTSFPQGKHDDQVDSTSQALDWFKQRCMRPAIGIIEYYRPSPAEGHAGETYSGQVS